MNCESSNPVDYEGNAPEPGELWHFKDIQCTSDQTVLLSSSDTDAEFYLNKTLDYGQIVLIIILSIALIFGILNFLWNFFFKK